MRTGRDITSAEFVSTVDVDVSAALVGGTGLNSTNWMVDTYSVAMGDAETTIDTGKVLR